MKSVVGEMAVEMLEDQAEDALAGAAVEVQNGEGVSCYFAGYFFKGGGVEGFLVAEVVIEQGLVDAGRGGDGAGTRAGEAVLAEFADGGVENAVAGLIGTSVLGSRH
jgi:hypothetical protein